MPDYTKLIFHKPGMLTTVQDFGRPNFREYGVPAGGALDRAAMSTANDLVGNKKENPILEITLMGPEIYFEKPAQIAIAGADISPTINGRVCPMCETVNVPEKATLKFGRLINGCRAYLAVAGKWKVEKWLGSHSALPGVGTEILPQNSIQKNSELIIEKGEKVEGRKIENEKIPKYSEGQKIRVMPGPEFEKFPRRYIAHFFSHTHRVSPNSSRMGCRLENGFIPFQAPHELISSPVIPGTIQITNSGQPIVLLADAQTTGGYFRFANVILKDMDTLAQVKPGDELWFVLKV